MYSIKLCTHATLIVVHDLDSFEILSINCYSAAINQKCIEKAETIVLM